MHEDPVARARERKASRIEARELLERCLRPVRREQSLRAPQALDGRERERSGGSESTERAEDRLRRLRLGSRGVVDGDVRRGKEDRADVAGAEARGQVALPRGGGDGGLLRARRERTERRGGRAVRARAVIEPAEVERDVGRNDHGRLPLPESRERAARFVGRPLELVSVREKVESILLDRARPERERGEQLDGAGSEPLLDGLHSLLERRGVLLEIRRRVRRRRRSPLRRGRMRPHALLPLHQREDSAEQQDERCDQERSHGRWMALSPVSHGRGRNCETCAGRSGHFLPRARYSPSSSESPSARIRTSSS